MLLSCIALVGIGETGRVGILPGLLALHATPSPLARRAVHDPMLKRTRARPRGLCAHLEASTGGHQTPRRAISCVNLLLSHCYGYQGPVAADWSGEPGARVSLTHECTGQTRMLDPLQCRQSAASGLSGRCQAAQTPCAARRCDAAAALRDSESAAHACRPGARGQLVVVHPLPAVRPLGLPAYEGHGRPW